MGFFGSAGIGAIFYALPALSPRLTPDHLAAAYGTGLTGQIDFVAFEVFV